MENIKVQSLFGEDFNDEAWKKEWRDMPEFVQEDAEPYKSLIINFESEKDLQEFATFIDQKLTNKTKSIWFPKYSRERPSLFLYINENES
jgi:hypothetical protein